jgi:hypothetical protein
VRSKGNGACGNNTGSLKYAEPRAVRCEIQGPSACTLDFDHSQTSALSGEKDFDALRSIGWCEHSVAMVSMIWVSGTVLPRSREKEGLRLYSGAIHI